MKLWWHGFQSRTQHKVVGWKPWQCNMWGECRYERIIWKLAEQKSFKACPNVSWIWGVNSTSEQQPLALTAQKFIWSTILFQTATPPTTSSTNGRWKMMWSAPMPRNTSTTTAGRSPPLRRPTGSSACRQVCFHSKEIFCACSARNLLFHGES